MKKNLNEEEEECENTENELRKCIKEGVPQQITPTHCVFQRSYCTLIQHFLSALLLLHTREYTLAYSLICNK